MWWLSFALAQDSGLLEEASLDEEDMSSELDEVVPEREVEPDLEVIISADRLPAEARARVEADLRAMGYKPVRDKGDRTVWIPEEDWRQKVIIHDDGWIYFRKRPPHLRKPDVPGDLWFEDVPVLEYGPCVMLPLACVSRGSMLVNPKLLEQDRSRVVVATQKDLSLWGDALAGEALEKRVNEEVPALLDSIWYEGVGVDGEPLTDPEARRAAILDFWVSRTDNEYGDAVRKAVESYMNYVVQRSEHPFTPEEIAAANARRTCQRELVLER